MAEAARAVGPGRRTLRARPIQPDHGHLWDVLGDLHELHEQTSAKIDGLVEVIGKPGAPDGGEPATGIFAHLKGHDQRISKFERYWERGIGFGLAAVPLLSALWWLAGDKIAKLLHG